jgi:hypothetical protein
VSLRLLRTNENPATIFDSNKFCLIASQRNDDSNMWQPGFRRQSIRNGSNDSRRVVASLDRKRLGQGVPWQTKAYTRGVFDKETRRKPLAFAADALSYGV